MTFALQVLVGGECRSQELNVAVSVRHTDTEVCVEWENKMQQWSGLMYVACHYWAEFWSVQLGFHLIMPNVMLECKCPL